MSHEFKIQDVHDQTQNKRARRIPNQLITCGHVFTCTARCHQLRQEQHNSSVIHSLLPKARSRRDDDECCRTVLLLCRGKQAPRWPVYRPDLEADVSQQSCSTDGFNGAAAAQSALTSAKTEEFSLHNRSRQTGSNTDGTTYTFNNRLTVRSGFVFSISSHQEQNHLAFCIYMFMCFFLIPVIKIDRYTH